MTKALFPLLACVALASCQGQTAASEDEAEPAGRASPAPAAAPAARPAGMPLTAVGDLLGEYRVAGIDGKELAGNLGIAASIDGPTLSFEPTCAGFVWQLAFVGGRLVTERPGMTAPPGGTSRPVCAVAVHPEQRRLAEALDAADSATRTPDNGIVLSGGGRSLTLFSQ